jgi:hypothetical protein
MLCVARKSRRQLRVVGIAMSIRHLLLASACALSPLATAQAPATYDPPRTAEGRPDFHGVWASVSITAVERPSGVTVLTPTQQDADAMVKAFWDDAPDVDDPDIAISDVRKLSVVRGSLRTSHLIEPADGRLPYTAAGRDLALLGSDSSVGRHDHPEERPVYERCLGGFGHPPMRTIPIVIPTLIVQTPATLVLQTEDVAGFRAIHFDREAPPPDIRAHEGWSSGRWEGDTLVIETTHFRPDDHWRNDYSGPIVVNPGSKVIERLTLLSNSELLYQFTVQDTDLYAQPWLAEFSFRRHDGPIYEYACHEANYSIVNVLLAGRVADAREAAKK